MEDRKYTNVIIHRDFNIKGRSIKMKEKGVERKSKDIVIGKDGKRLINWI